MTRNKRPTDTQRLNWLRDNKIMSHDELLWVAYMPTHLEDGQTLRQGIDAAMRQEGKRK